MAQAQSVALPSRLPLVIEPQNRSDSTDKDSKLVNCYMEKQRAPSGEIEYWIYKRPGIAEQSRPPGVNAVGSGIYNWRGDIYSIFVDKLYKNGVAIVGTVNNAGGVYRFSSTLGATPKLQMGNGLAAYNYDTAGGLVEIIDPDFPAPHVKGWAYLNGTTYAMDPDAGIWGDDINDPVTWPADNVIIAQIEPDFGMALAKQLVYVIALKQWSTEVFYDAANATGSPLGRVEGAKANYGTVSDDSVQDVDGMLFWIGSSRSAATQIIRFANLKLDVISTPAIERLLQDVDFTLETVYSWQLSVDGHRHYVFTLVSLNLTLAFDIDESQWWQWTDEAGNYMPICASTFSAGNRALLQHVSNGRIYYASSTYTNDDGGAIIVDVVTPNWDAGVEARGKAVKRLVVIADQEAGSALEIRTNDHDFEEPKWTQPRKVDLGQKLPCLDDLGVFNRRSHWFRHRSNTRLRLKAIEVQMDLGVGPAP